MGKVHGGLANAGKVRGQTPRVEKDMDKPKQPKGRAFMRKKYNRRYAELYSLNPKRGKGTTFGNVLSWGHVTYNTPATSHRY